MVEDHCSQAGRGEDAHPGHLDAQQGGPAAEEQQRVEGQTEAQVVQHVRRLYWMDSVSFVLILLSRTREGGVPALAGEQER